MPQQPTEPEKTSPDEVSTGQTNTTGVSSADAGKDKRNISPLVFMGAGIEFASVCAGMALVGWWLDGQFDSKPWLMVIGLAMGLIGGIYKLYKTGKRFFN